MSSTRRSTYARARTKSNINPSNLESQHSQQRPFATSSASSLLGPTTKQDPMTPSSRYLHNLRVIQRHDPTITSLFDQFPHVCVYHHKGDEWQKKGCEGAMFLFEREEEPKYGFYILNRNNTGDYIQRLTPDDDVELANAYLIYRAYGKVTSDTIGLWTMVTHDREAMSQVMMRLHSYVRRGERYPDIYRRKPETWSTTPAPAHAHAHAQFVPQPQIQNQTQTQTQPFPQTPTHSYTQPHLQFPLQSSPYLLHSPAQQQQPTYPSSGAAQTDLSSSISTFTNLIAKLDNSHAQSTAPSTSSPFLQTSITHSGARFNNVNLKAPDRTISASVPPSRSSTGIPLLDSIFASASGASAAATPTQPSHPGPTFFPPSSAFQQTRMNGLGQSPSSSSGVTPTQPISELPRSFSPSRKPLPSISSTSMPSSSPLVVTANGVRQGLNTSMRGVLPFPIPTEQSPRSSRRYGRESAPPGKVGASYLSNGVHHVPTPPRRHNSAQYSHMSIPEAKEEEEKEGEGEGVEEGEDGDGRIRVLANTSIGGVMDSQVPTMPPGGRLKSKKRERKREGGGGKLQQQQQTPSDVKQDGVEWTLVDDRSLSVDDEESEEGEVSGLGDGLMDAIATLSESDAYMSGAKEKEKAKANGARGLFSVNGSRNGASGVLGSREVTTANAVSALASPRSNAGGANGRGRRKRKTKERGEVDNKLAFLSSSATGGGNGTTITTTITNGTSPSNGTGDTTAAAAVDASGPTTLHNLNLDTNVTSYSSPSSSGFPPPPEITRAPSSSSASSRSFHQHQQHNPHRLHSTGIPAISTAEVRTALMQTYDGSRGRVGDDVGDAVTLGEEEFKAEIVNLINDDPTFMKELYQIYLSKVKV